MSHHSFHFLFSSFTHTKEKRIKSQILQENQNLITTFFCFLKEDHLPQSTLQRCSISLVIRKMQTKTILSNQFMTTRNYIQRRQWQPTPVLLPGEPRDGRACWAAIYGVARSRTRLKRLSGSRRNYIGLAKKFVQLVNTLFNKVLSK